MEPPLVETGSIPQVIPKRVIWLHAEKRPIRLDWASILSGLGSGLSTEELSITERPLIWMENPVIQNDHFLIGMPRERNGSGMFLIMLFHPWARMEPIRSL